MTFKNIGLYIFLFLCTIIITLIGVYFIFSKAAIYGTAMGWVLLFIGLFLMAAVTDETYESKEN